MLQRKVLNCCSLQSKSVIFNLSAAVHYIVSREKFPVVAGCAATFLVNTLNFLSLKNFQKSVLKKSSLVRKIVILDRWRITVLNALFDLRGRRCDYKKSYSALSNYISFSSQSI